MDITLYHFKEHSDPRGKLVAVEPGKDIPFPIRRVYYMYGVDAQARRGLHAHKQLEQVLICMNGSCKILLDNGRERRTVTLDRPDVGLYVGHAMWREMFDFTPGAVLAVLASLPYDEADYIRDYDTFLEYIKGESQG